MNMSNDDYWMDAHKCPPPTAGEYLCAVSHTRTMGLMKRVIGYYGGGGWAFASGAEVHYWMPLPKLPHFFAPTYERKEEKLAEAIAKFEQKRKRGGRK